MTQLNEMFAPTELPEDADGCRTCGNCAQRKSTDNFYKDGRDSDGDIKYRRDCKECYRKTRVVKRNSKKLALAAPQKRKRGKNRK